LAKQFEALDARLTDFIARQHVFFVASAAAGSRINLSPKGLDCLRVVGPNEVLYLDQTGSGSETSAHMKADGRLTIMFCAFEGAPMILRLYGRGRSILRGEAEYAALLAAHVDGREPHGARQIVSLAFDLVQTSCGFAVPLMDYVEDRPSLTRWSEAKSEAELAEYRAHKNALSIDGLPTGMR